MHGVTFASREVLGCEETRQTTLWTPDAEESLKKESLGRILPTMYREMIIKWYDTLNTKP